MVNKSVVLAFVLLVGIQSCTGAFQASLFSVRSSKACNYWHDKIIDGNDLGNETETALDSCCNLCSSNSKCAAFQWKDVDGGTCWMKMAAGPYISGVGYTLGAKEGVQIFCTDC